MIKIEKMFALLLCVNALMCLSSTKLTNSKAENYRKMAVSYTRSDAGLKGFTISEKFTFKKEYCLDELATVYSKNGTKYGSINFWTDLYSYYDGDNDVNYFLVLTESWIQTIDKSDVDSTWYNHYMIVSVKSYTYKYTSKIIAYAPETDENATTYSIGGSGSGSVGVNSSGPSGQVGFTVSTSATQTVKDIDCSVRAASLSEIEYTFKFKNLHPKNKTPGRSLVKRQTMTLIGVENYSNIAKSGDWDYIYVSYSGVIWRNGVFNDEDATKTVSHIFRIK